MIEILEFIFTDLSHFIGFLILWIVMWGCICNINLVNITNKKYHLVPKDLMEFDDDSIEEEK